MPHQPPSTEFDAKLEQARQLLEGGCVPEALDLVLEALQEEIRKLHAYFRKLRQQMEPKPPPGGEAQCRPTPPAAPKPDRVH